MSWKLTPLNSFRTNTSPALSSGTPTWSDRCSAVSAGPGSKTRTARIVDGRAVLRQRCALLRRGSVRGRHMAPAQLQPRHHHRRRCRSQTDVGRHVGRWRLARVCAQARAGNGVQHARESGGVIHCRCAARASDARGTERAWRLARVESTESRRGAPPGRRAAGALQGRCTQRTHSLLPRAFRASFIAFLTTVATRIVYFLGAAVLPRGL